MTDARSHRRHERLPRTAVLLAAFTVVFFCLPFIGLLWRTPWTRLLDVFGDSTTRDALWLSMRTSITAAVISVFLGVPLAWTLASIPFRGRNIVRSLCLISMVLPPVVGGISLLFSLGRSGLFGRYLDDWFGFRFTSVRGVSSLLRCSSLSRFWCSLWRVRCDKPTRVSPRPRDPSGPIRGTRSVV